ncbi:type II toxin-antitoxin system Phd/YefM family antitoxin [Sphingobium sp. YR768]|uniref:type II toxin-antitoxin system Phd/YefM family antitoxin n=1 Tax=Sphingobium sp. YR768 TaxID=1884365 RepID=UPI0008BEB116|nr:type II toxin-antitoxin system prevent-host-death family antitoxin [Sphingobium sp. YR768]SEQ87354.1 prevent-host-death family protein [Sphingobium sp. YR768]
MDRHISASDADRHFSDMLREVVDGESFTITSEGRAVARVMPVDPPSQKEAVRRLLAYVSTLPRRYSGDWKREDLYE